MSFAAVAITGAAVVGAVGSSIAADKSSRAVKAGADAAAQAQIISTELQIEEIRRQYDYQQQILLPQIQQQYNAQGAFADLLGIGGPNPAAVRVPTPDGATATTPTPPPGGYSNDLARRYGVEGVFDGQGRVYPRPRDSVPPSAARTTSVTTADATGARYPGRGGTTFTRGPGGEFIDSNLDPTQLADVATYGDTVRGNLLAGPSAESDPYRNYVADNAIAAATAAEDARVARARDVTLTDARGGDSLEARRANASLAAERAGVSLMDERGNVLMAPGTLQDDVVRGDIAGRSLAAGAAGTGVYGDTFEASPGYEFAIEEMNRATDRLRSRGGNYGGRAILEAQRRAEGLAAQDYYNWAAGRERDLTRLAGAEAQDAARLDQAAYSYQDRLNRDILRGDEFARTDIARGDEFARTDIARGDQFAGADLARLDEFAYRDIARGDVALEGYESQRIADVGRRDQAYMDYLRRREGDAARLDAAAIQEDQLRAADRQRTDQAYYNYVANLGRVAGFGGGSAATAVDASAAASSQVAGAYRTQGGNLASIYSNLGNQQGQIEGARVAGITNAITGGISNYVTWDASRPPPPPKPQQGVATLGVPA